MISDLEEDKNKQINSVKKSVEDRLEIQQRDRDSEKYQTAIWK
jgi:hypothetical protein